MKFSNYYGMDTENDENGVVTLCAVYGEDGKYWIWKKAGEFRKWCDENKDRAPIVFCHNLEYDLVNEFGAFFPYLSLTYLKGKLISAQYGRVKFFDSFNHYRMALKKIGEAFGIKKLAYDIYSEDYVLTDAKIPVMAMAFTRDYLESIGGEMGATAGSSAISVWLNMTGSEFLTGPLDNEWLRAGYAGGRTEIFRSRTEGNIKGYDVNSMYPYCMISEYPMLLNEDLTISKRKGMAECTVSVPTSDYVGPLFWRDAKDRLVYPVGRFRGIWTYDELRYAESLGTKILKVHKSIGSNYCERPFDDYIYTIYAKRKASTNPAEREVLKVILNSLYGKLASRNCITRVVSKYELLKSGNKRIKDVQWIDHNRGLLDFFTPQQRYVNVLWGAMVTANARILLTKYLRQVAPEKLCYCDTDSIYCLDTDLPLSPELGGLKLEKTAKIMTVLQPKAYRLDDDYKAKGVPKPKLNDAGEIVIDFAKQYMEDGLTEFQAPVRFRESLRRKNAKANQWVTKKKGRKTDYTAKALSGYRYFPPIVGEQQDLFTAANVKGVSRNESVVA